ncbi:cupin domain-containing protein [Pseudomonas sp. N040]|uniref:cupin domain-containing protein n=1 Tax=Pseudomonas sp. N040 TaxID=2785325 RepID=UPI0018A32EDC|nr:cupin domain-containing protein [Pseudomonas sp. N040]MBF7731426.1 cupin domain-containing protein [Pseudomonas sp. N040]MBW7015070.1 cupin domain-containing protein [Pseudomonas sp. N040]
MNITHFKNTPEYALPATSTVALPLGEPVAMSASHGVERNDGVEAGIWECSPGRWRRQIVQQEFCHIISGSCTFTPDGGEAIEIRAGDALVFPANTTGIWDIRETVRKTYLLIG